ncbi:Mobile element protein [Azospirillum endophyticum]
MVEEMLAARGITVSHETVRQWGRKFGPEIAPGCAAGRHGGATRGISTKSS